MKIKQLLIYSIFWYKYDQIEHLNAKNPVLDLNCFCVRSSTDLALMYCFVVMMRKLGVQ
jgi:hypothetical protein